MKKIIAITKGDLRRISRSAVAIVIIIGIITVPCLYAWFNIFSNWDPYGTESTGRIKVAVASLDEGSSFMGIKMNVGDMLKDGLKANDSIGWVIVDDSEEALESVYSGECYAAIIVPEDFSDDILSFQKGDLTKPSIMYYQNDKKNAIAPKITGSAKNVLEREINKVFLSTIGGYLTDAYSVFDASGIDADGDLSGIQKRIDDVINAIDKGIVVLNSFDELTDTAQNFIDEVNVLSDDIDETIDVSEEAADTLNSNMDIVSEDLTDAYNDIYKGLTKIDKHLGEAQTTLKQLDAAIKGTGTGFVGDLEGYKTKLNAMGQQLGQLSTSLKQLAYGLNQYGQAYGNSDLLTWSAMLNGAASQIDASLGELSGINTQLSGYEALVGGMTSSLDVKPMLDMLDEADDVVIDIRRELKTGLNNNLHHSVENIQDASLNLTKELDSLGHTNDMIGTVLNGYVSSLTMLDMSNGDTIAALNETKASLRKVSNFIGRIRNNDTIIDFKDALDENGEVINEFFDSPVDMVKVKLYDTQNFGSAMSAFYTVLAQWIGALFACALIKARIREEDKLPKTNFLEGFFGRFGVFFLIAIAQALLVSAGDILYCGIHVKHPLMFVLGSVVTGILFMLINFCLEYALGTIGLGVSVIFMVIQVAGSGGTFPVQVLPHIFRELYRFMPFNYAMNALRECIGGFYDTKYFECLAMLALMSALTILAGIILYYPGQLIARQLEKDRARSEIMCD